LLYGVKGTIFQLCHDESDVVKPVIVTGSIQQ